MPVGHRGTVAGLVLATSLAACALLDGDRDVADCDVIRVAFEDELWRLGGEQLAPADGVEDGTEPPASDTEALRRVVDLHDTRRDCFDDDVDEFLDPARHMLDDEQQDALEDVPFPDAEEEAPFGDTFGE